MKLLFTLLGSATLIGGSFAIAQETIPLQSQTVTDTQTQDSYLPDETVSNFDVTTAYDTMQSLQSSVDGIVKELYALDAQQRSGDTISAKYREVRNEIVNVIQTINTTTDNVGSMLKKIAVYKRMIQIAYQDLQDSRKGFTNTKEYLATFANFIYKLDNKLYDGNSQTIDDVKLIVNSDNIPRTLANDAMVESMLVQFNDLLDNFTTNEQKQLDLIKKLNQMKIQAQADIKDYAVQLEQLQQKKNYLMQFIALYSKDSSQRQLTINTLFDSTKSVYDKIVELAKGVKKGVYTDSFDMGKKMKELTKIADDTQTYPIARPLYPIENILTYFGDVNYQTQYGIPHIGIGYRNQSSDDCPYGRVYFSLSIFKYICRKAWRHCQKRSAYLI
ncbi:MAG: hypothetical protein NTX91_04530 [candidate division SR1 bacterium]|nr:hypothetical protein [candidate division SR1 bacterium]